MLRVGVSAREGRGQDARQSLTESPQLRDLKG